MACHRSETPISLGVRMRMKSTACRATVDQIKIFEYENNANCAEPSKCETRAMRKSRNPPGRPTKPPKNHIYFTKGTAPVSYGYGRYTVTRLKI